ncbi:MAG: LysR family transcriptional regulator [Planctomycetota bacterium]
MELRHLNYFLVLSEELHFGRAAEKLFIAQPPLSRQIKQLEEELGVPLFKRTKQKITLTSYGDYLQKEAVKIFQHLESVENHIKFLKEGMTGQVKIGYISAVIHSFLPDLLARMKAAFPDINTVLMELNNESQLAALRTGRIDLGFMRRPESAGDIIIEPLYAETFSLIVAKSHPLAQASQIKLKDLADEPFIGFSSACGRRIIDKITLICRREGFTPRMVHETSQVNTVIRLVEKGLGYSIVPSSIQTSYKPDVAFHNLDSYPEKIELCLAYHPENSTPLCRKLVSLITQPLVVDS